MSSSAVKNRALDIFKGQRSCRDHHPVDVQELFCRRQDHSTATAETAPRW